MGTEGSFIYDIGTKVYFGREMIGSLGKELSKFGSKVLLCYGGGSIKQNGLYDSVVKSIEDAKLIKFELSGIEPNPRIESVRNGAKICKEEGIDAVLAVGGGSVIDAAKFIAAGACYDVDPWEMITTNFAIKKSLPIVTALTTAATGSEMDTGGVISKLDTNDKVLCMAPVLRPRVSFMDPTTTYTTSRRQTACGSADILSHIMETYFVDAAGSMFMLDRFKEGMMQTVIKYAPIALADPENYEARENLMWASSWAINGFSGAKQNCNWSCHPIEHVVSGYYDITHAVGLAILTPRWMRYILDETTVDRFYDFAVNVFGIVPSDDKMAAAEEGIKALETFFYETLGLPKSFTEIGIDDKDFKAMAEKICEGDALYGYRTLKPTDIVEIFKNCL